MPTYLIEEDTRHFLRNNLKSCHVVKMNYYSIVLNISVLLMLVFGFGYVLYSRYRGFSEYELEQKALLQQKHIVARIRSYHELYQQKQRDENNDDDTTSRVDNLPVAPQQSVSAVL